MVPGEYLLDGPDIEVNAGRPTVTLRVNNTGDRPIQVGSHFHFFEVNRALVFEREQAYGMRLDLPAGTAIRFEPGDVRDVQLVPMAGERIVYGLNGLVSGRLDDAKVRAKALAKPTDGAGGAEPQTTGREKTAAGHGSQSRGTPGKAQAGQKRKAARRVKKRR